MFVDVFFSFFSAGRGPRTIGIIIQGPETFRQDDQFRTRDVILLNRLCDEHFRHALTISPSKTHTFRVRRGGGGGWGVTLE